MTSVETAAVITAVAAAVGSLTGMAAAIGTWLNGRALRVLKTQTDGMKTELVNEVRNASFAQGVKSEKDKE